MSIFDLFSKRQKRARGDVPDVYLYDKIPQELRVQIVHIWRDVLGDSSEYHESYTQSREAYKFIVETLCREYGLFGLPGYDKYGDRNYLVELANFLLQEQNHERVMDAVELSFRVADRMGRSYEFLHKSSASERVDKAIEELNARFREHGVGYQYSNGEILRVDSEFLHKEAILPALTLLRDKRFRGAQEEFLKAHEHYRRGNSKEALNECLKALESTMKSICERRKWKYDANATAKTLCDSVFAQGLVPGFWLQQFSALRSVL